jgi:hypothetical protein
MRHERAQPPCVHVVGVAPASHGPDEHPPSSPWVDVAEPVCEGGLAMRVIQQAGYGVEHAAQTHVPL